MDKQIKLKRKTLKELPYGISKNNPFCNFFKKIFGSYIILL